MATKANKPDEREEAKEEKKAEPSKAPLSRVLQWARKHPTGFTARSIAADLGLPELPVLGELIEAETKGWFTRSGAFFYLTQVGQVEIDGMEIPAR
jgi:hypothetical protein